MVKGSLGVSSVVESFTKAGAVLVGSSKRAPKSMASSPSCCSLVAAAIFGDDGPVYSSCVASGLSAWPKSNSNASSSSLVSIELV
jgi:hypothetical protein